MAKYQRIRGGEKNEKAGIDWTRSELEQIADLYVKLGGKNIHENNTEIHKLAEKLGRTIRSVENQLLGFRKVATGDTGRKNYNRLIPTIWSQKNKTSPVEKQEKESLHFKVSSALKDIIGRDLIPDDFIAIFELVKNSFDAHATRVDIYFNDINTPQGSIVIKDNGKGMDREDLLNKWLFLAYSAKTEGTEDDNYDYRDNIYNRRAFAGAKGIGRFSCDRLGAQLVLETIKKKKDSQIEELRINWNEFEEDSKREFVEIDIAHKVRKRSAYDLKSGTVLDISALRSEWDRPKLLKLKDSLSKLINPNRGKGEQPFKILIHAPTEIEKDKEEGDESKKVNGEVKNFVFETLGLKTTKIYSSISNDGDLITTELVDGGTLIYRITEKNGFQNLDSIDCTLFYLNQPAKITFIKKMGVPSNRYGHIFLYKNGFRIYPYGEPGEDPLKIDLRKAQGTRRFLGTRELIGQLEIFTESDQFRETSSRGDGLIKNDSYNDLVDFFNVTLRRLEKYVVDVQKWGLSIETDRVEIKKRLGSLIANLTGSSSIIRFETADNLIELLEDAQSKSAVRAINNLKTIAIETKNDRLLKAVESTNKRLEEIWEAKEQAEKEAEEQRKKAAQASKKLKETESENLFLKSLKSQDLTEIVSFMHSIGISASSIDNYLSGTYRKINRRISINPVELNKIIEAVSFENRKILSITRFATKANFKLFSEETTVDLIEFVREYLYNIVAPLRKGSIEISVGYPSEKIFKKTIKPIEITILLDNLISNSIRAKAKIFSAVFKNKDDQWMLIIEDDGKGIPDDNLLKVFDFGFTTTSGSGLGLHHVKQILSNIAAQISINNKIKNGVQFIITF